jgi:hypothetical protein
MPSLNSLLNKLRKDYPALTFEPGERFKFTPPATICYADGSPLELLHELGHFLIEKNTYTSDIELIRIESEAWDKAKQLCKTYKVKWDEDFAQDHIDTYRDWLHVVSLCKNCQLAGYQDESSLYHCPLCGAKWESSIPPEDF